MSSRTSTYEKQVISDVKNTPKEYLPNLAKIIRLFRESVSLKPAKASFRQGMEGDTGG